MKFITCLFLVLLLVGSVACGETADSNKAGLTLKAAWATAEPQIKSWQADAVFVSVFNPPDSSLGIDLTGRASQWYIEAVSLAALKRSNWLVSVEADGKATVIKSTEDELDQTKAEGLNSRALPALATLIDTNRLFEIARQNGGNKSDKPLGIHLAQPLKEGEPLVFDLVFYNGEQVLRLRIDAYNGELVENVKG